MSYAYSLWIKNCISYWIRHISSILVWFRGIRILFSFPFLSRSDLFIILLLYPSLVILSVLWALFLISARVSVHVWIYLHTLVPTYFIFTGIYFSQPKYFIASEWEDGTINDTLFIYDFFLLSDNYPSFKILKLYQSNHDYSNVVNKQFQS